jgi:4a-hydroxytetrahydrobiopterin dehydratase
VRHGGGRRGAARRDHVARLTDQGIAEALAGLPGWERHGETLQKTFVFPSFPDGVAFLVRLAFEAEAADHHPDVSIRYRQLTLSYWTHVEGGITAKDVEGAGVADRLAAAWRAGSS